METESFQKIQAHACYIKKRQENPVKGYKGPSPVTSRLFYYFLHCAEHKKK